MVNLVPITPIEYQKKRIVRYFGYRIGALTAEHLVTVIREYNVTKIPKIWQEGDLVFYEYPKKPLIIIRDGRFYTTEDVWNSGKFTWEEIRHQASILLRILKDAQLAKFHRKAIPIKRFIPRMFRKPRNTS